MQTLYTEYVVLFLTRAGTSNLKILQNRRFQVQTFHPARPDGGCWFPGKENWKGLFRLLRLPTTSLSTGRVLPLVRTFNTTPEIPWVRHLSFSIYSVAEGFKGKSESATPGCCLM